MVPGYLRKKQLEEKRLFNKDSKEFWKRKIAYDKMKQRTGYFRACKSAKVKNTREFEGSIKQARQLLMFYPHQSRRQNRKSITFYKEENEKFKFEFIKPKKEIRLRRNPIIRRATIQEKSMDG